MTLNGHFIEVTKSNKLSNNCGDYKLLMIIKKKSTRIANYIGCDLT